MDGASDFQARGRGLQEAIGLRWGLRWEFVVGGTGG